MTQADLIAALRTRDLGREAWLYRTLPSTQDRAQALAFAGCAHGTLVHTEVQTAGRGRAGRPWISGAGSLTFSVVLNRGIELSHPSDWSFVAGLALHDAFAPHAKAPLELKWPNDVMVDGRKFAGILCSLETGSVPSVVCGVGVNLAFDPGAMDASLKARAGSFPGASTDSAHWLGRILGALERRAEAHLRLGRAHTREAYAGRLAHVGQRVEVTTAHGTERGLVRGIDDDFALLLDADTGVQLTVATADVWPMEKAAR